MCSAQEGGGSERTKPIPIWPAPSHQAGRACSSGVQRKSAGPSILQDAGLPLSPCSPHPVSSFLRTTHLF